MRTKTLRVASATATPWIRCNSKQTPFSLGYAASISDSASLTYSVEQGYTDPFNEKAEVTITRSTTTATLKFPMDVSAAVGDSIYVVASGDSNLDGWYQIASVSDSKTITYTVQNSGATASNVGCKALLVHVQAIASGKTGAFTGNVTQPMQYIRARITTYSSGSLSLTVVQSE